MPPSPDLELKKMTDFTRPFINVLVDMINAKNPTAEIAPEWIEIVSVEPTEGLTDGRNTTLRIAATPVSPYGGQLELYYTRVDIANIVATGDNRFEYNNRLQLSEFIAEINARFALNLTPSDYVDAALPPFEDIPGEEKIVTLVAQPDSQWIVGSVDLTIVNPRVALSTAVTDRELDGLTYETGV